MNATEANWLKDLEHSREISERERDGYMFVINWFESWRMGKRLEGGRASVRRFWKENVVESEKRREEWQKEQWVSGLRWYLVSHDIKNDGLAQSIF